MIWRNHVSRIPAAREAAYEAALRALGLAVEGVPALTYARREGDVIWHVVACDDATRAKLLAEVEAEDAETVGAGLAEVELGEGLHPDEVTEWRQPFGAGDAIPMLGDRRDHEGKTWESLIDWNIWQPPVGWREVVEDGAAAWVQPTGAHDAYPAGAVVTHNGKVWLNTHGNGNVWEPGVFGWAEQ